MKQQLVGSTVEKTAELKAVEGKSDEYEFVASTEDKDRYGDIIRVSGWDLKNYKKNPIVLFGHNHSNPVGIATKTWVEDKKLMVRIKLADEGTSQFIDTLRKLVQQRIVRAVSVGFAVTKEPLVLRDEKNEWVTGYEFDGQELLENSLVTVPANPQALAVARSMGLNELQVRRLFRADDTPSAKVTASGPSKKWEARLRAAELGSPARRREQ